MADTGETPSPMPERGESLESRLAWEGWYWRQRHAALAGAADPAYPSVARSTAELFEEAAAELERLRSALYAIACKPEPWSREDMIDVAERALASSNTGKGR